jgi:anti-sigma-K factor RskA
MRRLTCDEARGLAAPFVLGALEADEAEAVREHLATCREIHAEFSELGAVVPVLAETVERVEPPSALKARIMNAAAADLGTHRPIDLAERRQTRLRRPASPGLTVLARIAAVLAIVALGAWNILLQGQLDASRAYERDVAAVLDVAGRPGSLTAILTPDGGSGAGLAAVDAAGNVVLALRDLAPTKDGRVYEAWVIAADGIPVPLGSFTVGGGGTARLDASGLPAVDGIVLAITLESGPGATSPTLPIVTSAVSYTHLTLPTKA